MTTNAEINRIYNVLREHEKAFGIRDLRTHCLCGWKSTRTNSPREHTRHQAEQVVKYLEGQ